MSKDTHKKAIDDIESINEDIFRALFRKAAHEYLQDDFLDDIPDAGELENNVALSVGFETRIKNLINRAIRKERWNKTRKIAMKIAVGFLVFLTISTVVVMSAEALRVRVFNFFIDTKEKMTDIDIIDKKETSPPNNSSNSSVLVYVPEGFELISTEEFGSKTTLTYQNREGKTFRIHQHRSETKIGVDTENADYGQILINGNEAFYSHKDGMTVLVVKYMDTSVSIVGEISVEEAKRIAESMK